MFKRESEFHNLIISIIKPSNFKDINLKFTGVLENRSFAKLTGQDTPIGIDLLRS